MGYQIRNLSVECLTPVHIGSGVKMKRDMDFLISSQDREIGIIDHRKMMEAFGEDDINRETINRWVNAIDQQQSILPLLPSLTKIGDVSKRIRTYRDFNPNSELREQMHDTQNNPMIPGSSVKGSVRTAIWDAYVNDNSITYRDVFAYTKRNGDKVFKDNKLSKKVFAPFSKNRNRIDPNKDILRFLQITDVVFTQNQAICEVFKVLTEKNEGWKIKRFDENGECILKGAKARGRIKIDQKNLKNNIEKGYVRGLSPIQSVEDLFEACNQYTAKMLHLEVDFFQEDMDMDNDPVLYEYMNIIRSLAEEVDNASKDTCILRMGHGTGYRFMTGNKIFSDNINDDKLNLIFQSIRRDWRNIYKDCFYIKSRKITSFGSPLGFVKLKLLSE